LASISGSGSFQPLTALWCDGRDLKYFNFSNNSIITRSRFHGLTTLQGEQIAAYIRSLRFPNPGRP
jgi:hypothetical protein